MRIRSIKPEFWTDEKVGSWPKEIRLHFLGLVSYVNDYGEAEYNPSLIACTLYPYDMAVDGVKTIEFVVSAHRVFSESSVIDQKEVGGKTYFRIRNFLKHQKINRPNTSIQRVFSESSVNTHGAINKKHPLEHGAGSREQGTVEHGKDSGAAAEVPPAGKDHWTHSVFAEWCRSHPACQECEHHQWWLAVHPYPEAVIRKALVEWKEAMRGRQAPVKEAIDYFKAFVRRVNDQSAPSAPGSLLAGKTFIDEDTPVL